MKRALVVGAGIVGAACAERLARDGFVVTVIDHRPVGSVATGAGMGHILVMDDPPAEFALTLRSRVLWDELARELPASVDRAGCGTLWVAADDDEMAEAEKKRARLAAAGVAAELCTPARLAQHEPNLRPGLAGGLRLSEDSIVYPPAAAAWFLARAGAVGERHVHSARVERVESGRAMLADGRVLESDVIVLAAGLETRALVPGLPLRARKGHLVITDRHPGFCTNEIVELGYIKNAHGAGLESVACNVLARPNGQVLVGSSRQFDVEDLAIEPRMVAKVLARATEFLPSIAALRAIRAWTGLRATTPDGLPIVGPLPDAAGVFVATGHEGLGITASMGTAELVADLAAGRRGALDPAPYRVERFQEARRG